jgi:hypothetical protein
MKRPVIYLEDLNKTAIQVPIRNEFVELMRGYECGGVVWKHTHDEPTSHLEYWEKEGDRTCIRAQFLSSSSGDRIFGYSPESWYESLEFSSITLKQYYKKQKITSGQLTKMNKFFDA